MTVDGGVLLYGLGGDDPTRPDQREPFDLTGAAERIDQVAQTGIAEPPVIEIHDIACDEQPGSGYLSVVIPASPRGRHMLTINGDNRSWGRGATGNRILSEGEVARLYARRERCEQDRDQLLAQAVASVPPFTFNLAQVGLVGTVAQVMPRHELLRNAAGTNPVDRFLQQDLLGLGRQVDPYPDQGTTGLGDAFRISHPEPDLWLCEKHSTGTRNIKTASRSSQMAR
jgi:hypothetical protein